VQSEKLENKKKSVMPLDYQFTLFILHFSLCTGLANCFVAIVSQAIKSHVCTAKVLCLT
jgi:hypothetical protein